MAQDYPDPQIQSKAVALAVAAGMTRQPSADRSSAAKKAWETRRHGAARDDQSSAIEKISATSQAGSKLNKEWEDAYSKSHGESSGPFWNTQGEANAHYWIVREKGKLVAGATTVVHGMTRDLLSIASHSPGQGKKLLDDIKKRSAFITTLSSSKKSDEFYEANGFVRKEVKGQYNYIWKVNQ